MLKWLQPADPVFAASWFGLLKLFINIYFKLSGRLEHPHNIQASKCTEPLALALCWIAHWPFCP